ncbi:synaptojanin-1 isoform X3 [Oopsacas minuta]|uniref:Synaptojanin-1 isoform X3 n=1 Tax=Oopsacas minuta TaxID=111878 RepID=A0AAV7JSG1_9METZ|nr:synaptojanin-1 isoform X3 [Oopsacas minuta]
MFYPMYSLQYLIVFLFIIDFEEISISQVQNNPPENSPIFHLSIISRRSRYRAGTRYKRRGIDSDGYVANYVETELVIMVGSQKFSYVQVRGSIPIFWSQSGPKYKPLPQINKDFHSTQDAFELHISSQIRIYKHMSIVNLVDEIGKESIVKNEFESHYKALNSPHLNYFFFDFHKQCKGFQFSRLQEIFSQIREQFEHYNFFWVSRTNDQKLDLLCEQGGVFRVNCMDCLDRTNVIQAIIAREMLDLVLMKLGLLMPDQSLPFVCLQSYRKLWADNGDAISRQYAGTVAMKGDLTRTGHRNLKGTVRDGFSSANRYYINHFKDTLRQRVIDSMQDDLGIDPAPSENSIFNQVDIFENDINDPCGLIHAVREYLDLDENIRGWALKELDSFKCISSEASDQFFILLLLPNAILILLYQYTPGLILSYELLKYTSLESVQFGTFNKYKLLDRKHAIRIHYNIEGSTGYHYTLGSLLSKSDDIKLELSIVFNEIKLTTSRLNYFPNYQSIKLTNQISKPHKFVKINNIGSDLRELGELRQLIKIESHDHPSASQHKTIDDNTKDLKAKGVSSSTENLIIHDKGTEFYYIPNSTEKIYSSDYPILDHELDPTGILSVNRCLIIVYIHIHQYQVIV